VTDCTTTQFLHPLLHEAQLAPQGGEVAGLNRGKLGERHAAPHDDAGRGDFAPLDTPGDHHFAAGRDDGAANVPLDQQVGGEVGQVGGHVAINQLDGEDFDLLRAAFGGDFAGPARSGGHEAPASKQAGPRAGHIFGRRGALIVDMGAVTQNGNAGPFGVAALVQGNYLARGDEAETVGLPGPLARVGRRRILAVRHTDGLVGGVGKLPVDRRLVKAKLNTQLD
jgi:hypothetical protein